MNDSIAIKFCVTALRTDQEQLDVARRLIDLVQRSDLDDHVGVWMQGTAPQLSVHAHSEPGYTPEIHRDWIDDIEEQLSELTRSHIPHAEFVARIAPESLIC